MKNLILVLATLILGSGATVAHAEIQAPLWSCNLKFNAQGGGFKFVIGHYVLRGTGKISCTDSRGNREQIPVLVRIGTKPVSPAINIGKMKIAGVASGVGFARSPQNLLGEYAVAGVSGAIGVGGGLQVALHGPARGITLNGSLQAVSGFGVNIGFTRLEVIDARR